MPSRRVRILKRIAVIIASWVAVISGVILLTALTLGYQFNSKKGQVERGGILQIGSKPSGAKITINGNQFGSNTSAKLVSQPGEYALEIEKQGYRPWQKSVRIRPGGITWAAYPRLVPEQLNSEAAVELPKTLADALPSGSGKRYAFLMQPDKPVVGVAGLDSEEVKVAQVALPESAYTLSVGQDTQSKFEIVAWSGNERMILLHHVFGPDNTDEWVVLDREQPEKSVNLSKIAGVALTDVVFANGEGSRFYGLVNNDLRLLDTSDQTLGRPIVEDVSEYSLFEDGYILFVTLPTQQETQQVGYLKRNFKQPKVVDVVAYDGKNSAKFAVGKYYDTYYFLVAQGTEAVLSSSKSLTGELATPVKRETVKTLKLDKPITDAKITNNGQFVTIQNGSSFSTYNLESDRLSATKLLVKDESAPNKLRNLDSHLFWADNNGTLRTYEFDGANQYDIMPLESKFGATFSPTGKYLYAVQKTDVGYQLARVQFLDL